MVFCSSSVYCLFALISLICFVSLGDRRKLFCLFSHLIYVCPVFFVYGLKENAYSGNVQNNLTMDVLFEKV